MITISVIIQVVGVAIGLTLLCKIAATPTTNFINKLKVKITPIPQWVAYITKYPAPTPAPIVVTTEPYPIIRKFLDNLPDCNWCSACGSYARYVYLEAEKQGIPIGEITITASGTGLMNMASGHRMNYFYADDSHRVFINVNTKQNKRYILEFNEIKEYLRINMGIETDQIGLKDQKDIPT